MDDKFGLPTIQDIFGLNWKNQARDPRPEFRTAKFREDITEVAQPLKACSLKV